ncbi:MAG: M28 family peptidase [Pyrinomonadaceae bacterium]
MTAIRVSLNKLLKPFSYSVAFASLVLLLGCPSPANKPAQINSAAPVTPEPAKSDFDADRAFDYVRKQVEFGPRPPGSPELEKTRGYIIDQLRSFGLNVTTDEFHATTPVGDRRMVNIIAELPGGSNDIVIIGSHYDTKLFKEFKFVGANDAASSTGALMEIAGVLAAKKLNKLTYRFVFFDGEEAFCREWDDCHNVNPGDAKTPLPDNTYGSRHYVAQLVARNETPRVKAMILMDMMGFKNLRLGRADLGTTWLQDIVWQTGKQLGYKEFVDMTEGVGDDDHSPFLKAGIDSLDIIQLSTYGINDSEFWHTKEDTLDKISPKSLKIVGDTIIASLPKIEERIQSRSR